MAIYKKITKGGFIPFQTKGFTFGFEIEGCFDTMLMPKLPKGGNFKMDGSVSINDSENPIDEENRIEPTGRDGTGNTATEYNSPVFKTIEELIDCLKLFKRSEGFYYGNATCGVHLHIGYGKNKILHNKFGTREIMEQLQERFLPLICPCTRKRIDGDGHHWCNLHGNDYIEGRANNTGKYFAINLHHSGTIELRLFAPCQHLIANIQKVLTELFRVGYRDFSGEPNPITCIVSKSDKVEILEAFIPDKAIYSYGFNERSTYPISPLAQVADFQEYDKIKAEVEQSNLYYHYRNYQQGGQMSEIGRI